MVTTEAKGKAGKNPVDEFRSQLSHILSPASLKPLLVRSEYFAVDSIYVDNGG